jgi:hypothetical protein
LETDHKALSDADIIETSPPNSTPYLDAATCIKPSANVNLQKTQEDVMVGCLRKAFAAKDKEEQEQEKRAPTSSCANQRESDDEDHKKHIEEDKKLVGGLLEKLNLAEVEFEEVVRLRKKEEGKARPLQFKMKSLDQKADIMDSLSMLQNAGLPYT